MCIIEDRTISRRYSYSISVHCVVEHYLPVNRYSLGLFTHESGFSCAVNGCYQSIWSVQGAFLHAQDLALG